MNLKSKIFRGITNKIKCLNYKQHIRCYPRWSHGSSVQRISLEEYDNSDSNRQSSTGKLQPDTFRENNILWKRPNQQSLIKTNIEKEQVSQFLIKSHVQPLTFKKSNVSKDKSIDMLDITIDEDGNFIYTKMNDNDPRISQIMLEVKSKKEKEKKDLILLEGKRLIKEALDGQCKLEYILFSQLKDVEYLKLSMPQMGAKLYKVPYRDIQMWSNLITNPGIMGKPFFF